MRLRTRIQNLEQKHRQDGGHYRVWLRFPDQDTLTGPGGERLTVGEFNRRYPDAQSVVLTFGEDVSRPALDRTCEELSKGGAAVVALPGNNRGDPERGD